MQDFSNQPTIFQEQAQGSPMALEFLRWDRDDLHSPLSDYQAFFFDMATQQHPSVLTSFNLDVSTCSAIGLASIWNIINQSNLEHLVVVSISVDPVYMESIAQILHSIPWSSLTSLVLTGNNIDRWILLWPWPISPSLHCLQIRGTGSTLQEISHSSVLFFHHLASACPLSELEILNIQL